MSDTKQIAADLAPATVLAGRYRIEALLGKGGMGAVYRAYDQLIAREVAIKVINENKRLSTEIGALAALHDPHIVSIHAVECDEALQLPFLVLELIKGHTLSELGAASKEECVRIALQALSALSHAHSKSIVHRDLKPQNMMLDEQNQLKILDFGLAKVLGIEEQRLTQTGEIIGSAHYISPEQCLGGEITPRTDIYSLGASLYFLTTGKPPFDGDTPIAVCIKQTSESPDFNTIPDKRLAKIIAKAMAKNPADRFQSADEMAQALRSQETSINLATAADTKANDRSKQRSKLVAPLVMACLAIGAIGAVWELLAQDMVPEPPKVGLTSSEARDNLGRWHELAKTHMLEWWQYEYLERVEANIDDLGFKPEEKERLEYLLTDIAKRFHRVDEELEHRKRLCALLNQRHWPTYREFAKYFALLEKHNHKQEALEYAKAQLAATSGWDVDIKDFLMRAETYMLYHAYHALGDTANCAKVDKQLDTPDAAVQDALLLDGARERTGDRTVEGAWHFADYYLETPHSSKNPQLRAEAKRIRDRAIAYEKPDHTTPPSIVTTKQK